MILNCERVLAGYPAPFYGRLSFNCTQAVSVAWYTVTRLAPTEPVTFSELLNAMAERLRVERERLQPVTQE